MLDMNDDASDFRWHKLWNQVADKNVSDAHFVQFMEENGGFTPEDAIMFQCMRDGVLDFKLVRVEKENRDEEENEDELDDEEPEYRYEYSIDENNPNWEKYMKKLIALQIDSGEAYSVDNGKMLLDRIYDKCTHGLIKIDGLASAINDELDYTVETAVRNGLNPDVQIAQLDYEVEMANIDGKYGPDDDGNELESEEDRENKKQEHLETMEAHGDAIMESMRGAIYAHRGHSVFYAIFHPIKYYSEAKSIKNAKDALVKLGANRKKVDDFEKNVILEDKYLRDKKDYHRADQIGGLYVNVNFDSFVISSQNDKTVNAPVQANKEPVQEQVKQEAFINQLGNDIEPKVENENGELNADNPELQSANRDATNEMDETEDVLNTAVDEIKPEDVL